MTIHDNNNTMKSEMKRAYRVNFTKPDNIAVGIFIESRAGAATMALIRRIINIIIIECNVTTDVTATIFT